VREERYFVEGVPPSIFPCDVQLAEARNAIEMLHFLEYTCYPLLILFVAYN